MISVTIVWDKIKPLAITSEFVNSHNIALKISYLPKRIQLTNISEDDLNIR